jgi:ABC-type branched-subunit amino acid transport system ATPase component
MFIVEIYKALKERKNVLLVGPQGCGKTTVLKGITQGVNRKKVRYEAMGIINLLSRGRESLEHTVFVIDGTPSMEVFERINLLCADHVGLQFIFSTCDGDVPDRFMVNKNFAVIGWPESEYPP